MEEGETSIIPINRLRNYLRTILQEGLRDSDLKVSHVPFISCISRNPFLSVTEVARIVGMDKSTATRNIQQLVELGYVNRDGDPCKVNRVSLTDKGNEASGMIDRIQSDAYRRMLDGFGPGDEKEFLRMMDRLDDFLTREGF